MNLGEKAFLPKRYSCVLILVFNLSLHKGRYLAIHISSGLYVLRQSWTYAGAIVKVFSVIYGAQFSLIIRAVVVVYCFFFSPKNFF